MEMCLSFRGPLGDIDSRSLGVECGLRFPPTAP